MPARMVSLLLLVLAAGCSDQSADLGEIEENKGQIGASSGPNANFGGASSGDVYRASEPGAGEAAAPQDDEAATP